MLPGYPVTCTTNSIVYCQFYLTRSTSIRLFSYLVLYFLRFSFMVKFETANYCCTQPLKSAQKQLPGIFQMHVFIVVYFNPFQPTVSQKTYGVQKWNIGKRLIQYSFKLHSMQQDIPQRVSFEFSHQLFFTYVDGHFVLCTQIVFNIQMKKYDTSLTNIFPQQHTNQYTTIKVNIMCCVFSNQYFLNVNPCRTSVPCQLQNTGKQCKGPFI